MPNTIKHRTIAELQGWTTPPNSRPRRSITVDPTMVREPSQSTAFKPAQIGVLGVSSFKRRKIKIKTVPMIGTEDEIISSDSSTKSRDEYGDLRLM
jgi:hypothetical protein